MGQHFTLGAGPAQIMGQHVLPRLYGCRHSSPMPTSKIATKGFIVVSRRSKLSDF